MNALCQSKAHCATCLNSPPFRAAHGLPSPCPHGITADTLPQPTERDRALQAQARPQGPGSVLAGLFQSLGFKQEGGCGCAEMQNKMNAWGVEGCREHQDEILDFLEAKAKAQGIPFARLASKLALEVALNRSVPFKEKN
jgi:hypothetical protein